MKTKLISLLVLALFAVPTKADTKTKTEKKVRIFMIGDSTMANKEEKAAPETGWGMIFGEFFTNEVEVHNHALNGRSSKSFRGEGHWDKLYEQLQAGDYLFIQFGHNDQKDQSPDRFTNPFTTYRYNLERYVQEAREKGAIPVLLSSVVRRNFNEKGVLIDTHGNYPLVVRLVAEQMNIPLVDLQTLTELRVTELGTEASKKLFMNFGPGEYPNFPEGKEDNTHFRSEGAHEVAQMVIDELKKQGILTEYTK